MASNQSTKQWRASLNIAAVLAFGLTYAAVAGQETAPSAIAEPADKAIPPNIAQPQVPNSPAVAPTADAPQRRVVVVPRPSARTRAS